MVATSPVRNLIRDNKIHQLNTTLQLGNKDGMQTLDQSLASLVKQGIVEKVEAGARALDGEQFERWLKQPLNIVQEITRNRNNSASD
jgi:twitching motility protein PilT